MLAEGTLSLGRPIDRISVAAQATSLPSSSRSTPEIVLAEKPEAEGTVLTVGQARDDDQVVVSNLQLEDAATAGSVADTTGLNLIARATEDEAETGISSSTNTQNIEAEREQEKERLARISEELNERLDGQLSLRFRTDEETGIDLFQLIKQDSGEVVRQVPAEEIVEFMKRFQSFSGMLFSEQA
jgi:flagellar protein FlaG